MPDALDMLREYRDEACSAGNCELIVGPSDFEDIIDALEAERRENAERLNLARKQRDAFAAHICEHGSATTERDAKIRYHLERVLDQFDAAEAGKAAHAPDEYDFADAIRDALKALNGGSE